MEISKKLKKFTNFILLFFSKNFFTIIIWNSFWIDSSEIVILTVVVELVEWKVLWQKLLCRHCRPGGFLLWLGWPSGDAKRKGTTGLRSWIPCTYKNSMLVVGTLQLVWLQNVLISCSVYNCNHFSNCFWISFHLLSLFEYRQKFESKINPNTTQK